MGDEQVGQRFGGRYRVVRTLGRGGMGAVYEAVDENLGRSVALKVLLDELSEEARFLERFRREAETTARLGHPNIVQVTDFEEGPPAFLVMELLSGRSLYDALKDEGRIPPARACQIMVQVLSALGAAHAQGAVHRDLKPGNVFLVPLPHGELVKLLDFGIAKLKESDGFKRLTVTGSVVGTTRYASPEQLRAEAVDGRTDVFAAGVLLYTMLAGRAPFDGAGAVLMMQICEEDPPDLHRLVPDLPQGLAAVVTRALAKRPEERFQTAQEMADALAPHADATSTHATAASPPPTRPGAPVSPSFTAPTAAASPGAMAQHAPAPAYPPTRSMASPSPGAAPPRPAAPVTAVPPERRAGLSVAMVAALAASGLCLVGGVGLAAWSLFRAEPSTPEVGEPTSPPVTQVALPRSCDRYQLLACRCPVGPNGTNPCEVARSYNQERRRRLSANPALQGEVTLACNRVLVVYERQGCPGAGSHEAAADRPPASPHGAPVLGSSPGPNEVNDPWYTGDESDRGDTREQERSPPEKQRPRDTRGRGSSSEIISPW